MSMQWYVVQAHAGYEKKVRSALERRIEESSYRDCFGKILVPTEEVIEIRAGKRRSSTRNFFPGYVLVEMDLNDDTWHLVNAVPKVKRFLGGGRKERQRPKPLSEKEVATILGKVDTDQGPQLKTTFGIGETVRVIDGPFNDFNGEIEAVNYEKSRVRVSVSIFGRPTPVELDFSQVEKS